MTTNPSSRRAAGFTLVELLIVLAILSVILLIGLPALQRMIQRSQLLGFTSEVALMMNRARVEAIKRNSPALVVVDVANGTVFSYVDLNDGAGNPGTDLVFDPDAATTVVRDTLLGRIPLPSGVAAEGPTGGTAEDALVIRDFTTTPEAFQAAVFVPDGSARDGGAFRFRDGPGNFIEVSVAPPATGKVELRKWNTDETAWFAAGEGDDAWQWVM